MAESTPLTEAEITDLADRWYKLLDVHAPTEELLPLLLDDGLEMRFPEETARGHAGFRKWYERVITIFFDEVHTLKEVKTTSGTGPDADVKVVVNWQAKVWNPPEPKSKWLGFDAYQTWIVTRSPQSGKAVIKTYIVDDLAAMPGSATL
jgi:hypothetical protein